MYKNACKTSTVFKTFFVKPHQLKLSVCTATTYWLISSHTGDVAQRQNYKIYVFVSNIKKDDVRVFIYSKMQLSTE